MTATGEPEPRYREGLVASRYGRRVPWMIVLGDRDAIAWVLSHQQMAVTSRVAALPGVGDPVALYTTRGAFKNPTRDRAQVIGLGTVVQAPVVKDITIAGRTYAKSFGLRFDLLAELRQGLPFEPLVPKLGFIGNKTSWGGAVRRPVVRLPEADFTLIANRFRAHRAKVS